MTTASPSAARTVRAPHLGPERRRPQILDAALSLAVREGIGAVTIAALATELGVTRPVIYAGFGDRVELLTSLLDREQANLITSALDALHASGEADSPEQAFVDGFTALLDSAARRPDPWRLILNGEPDPAMSGRVAEARKVFAAEATAWIQPAMHRWWGTQDLDRKMPVLISLFMATCESGIRSLLDETNDWTTDDLGALLGSALFRAFKDA